MFLDTLYITVYFHYIESVTISANNLCHWESLLCSQCSNSWEQYNTYYAHFNASIIQVSLPPTFPLLAVVLLLFFGLGCFFFFWCCFFVVVVLFCFLLYMSDVKRAYKRDHAVQLFVYQTLIGGLWALHGTTCFKLQCRHHYAFISIFMMKSRIMSPTQDSIVTQLNAMVH